VIKDGTSSIRRSRSLIDSRTALMFCLSVLPLVLVVFCVSVASMMRLPNSLMSWRKAVVSCTVLARLVFPLAALYSVSKIDNSDQKIHSFN